MSEWNEHQQLEAGWWGDCANTFGEEAKQLVYASRMGLQSGSAGGKFPVFNVSGRNVVDLGGGPVSLLLKCINRGSRCAVVDPCKYPHWVAARYGEAGINYIQDPAEDFEGDSYEEAWIYNVLQHVQDPEKIIYNARKAARIVRIFDWIDIPPHPGHPHELKAETLEQWFDCTGTVEEFKGQNGLTGRAFYGVFA